MSAAGSVGIRFEGWEDLDAARDIARAAEAAGSGSLWLTQHLGGRDAMVVATVLAGATERMMIVPSNISPFIAHPMTTAMAAASIAELAPGRIMLSIGVGNQLDLRQAGVAVSDAPEAVADFAAGLRELLRADVVTRVGKTYSLDGAKMKFTPAKPIPLYITALGLDIAALAGRTADGVQLSAGFSPEFAGRCIEAYAKAAEKAGRDPASLGRRYAFAYFGKGDEAGFEGVRRKLAYLFRNRLMADNIKASGVAVDQDAIVDAIGRHDIEAAARLVPDAAVERFAICGTPDENLKTASRFFQAGIDELLINVGVGDEREAAIAFVRASSSSRRLDAGHTDG